MGHRRIHALTAGAASLLVLSGLAVVPATTSSAATTTQPVVATAVTPSGQLLRVQVDAPVQDVRVPGPNLDVNGRVTLSTPVDPLAVYVVDVSQSMRDLLGCQPADPDTLNTTLMDCAVGMVKSLLANTPASSGTPSYGIVAFAETAVTADMSPSAGDQVFTTSITDATTVASNLTYLGTGGVLRFTSKSVGANGTYYDRALTAAQNVIAQRPGVPTVVHFVSDGAPTAGTFTTGSGSPAAQLAAAGIPVNTYAIGRSSPTCAAGSALLTLATITGARCASFTSASAFNFVGWPDPSTVSSAVITLGGSSRTVALTSTGAFSTTFTNPPAGPFSVQVVANATGAGTTTAAATVTGAIDAAPVVDAGPPIVVPEGSVTTLTGATASDADDPGALTLQWTGSPHLGNPSSLTPTFDATNLDDSEPPAVLSVTATDPLGRTATDTRTVTVTNVRPTLDVGVSSSWIEVGQSIQLAARVFDPGLQDAVRVVVDWGDGTAPVVLDLPAPAAGGTTSRTVNLDHTFTAVATNEVRITAADDDDPNPAVVSQFVQVGPKPPASFVSSGGPYYVTKGSQVRLNGTYQYLGAGTPTLAWSTVGPVLGTLSYDRPGLDGIATPLFKADTTGFNILTLTMTLPGGAVASTPGGSSLVVERMLRATATSSVAQCPTGTVGQCASSTSLEVVADPNERLELGPVAPVSTPQGQPVPITIPWSNPGGDLPTFDLPTPPTHGTTGTTGPDPLVVTYTPQPGFCGTDTFTARAKAGAFTRLAEVSIRVWCRPSLDLVPDTLTFPEGESRVVTALAVPADEAPVTLATGPRPSWAQFSVSGEVNGQLVLSPGFLDAGTYDIDVTASTLGGSATKTVRVVVTDVPLVPNQPPVLGPLGEVEIPLGTPSVDVTIPWTDPDGPAGTPVVTLQTPPTSGTAVGPTPGTTTVTYTPAPGRCGTATFTVTATDAAGATSKAFPVTVRVVCPPTLDLPAVVEVPEGGQVVVVGRATSPDGSPVTFDVGPRPSFVDVSVVGTDAALTISPLSTDAGETTIPVTVTNAGGTVTKDLLVRVIDVPVPGPNRRPLAGPVTPTPVPPGTPVDIPIPYVDDGPAGFPTVTVPVPPTKGTPTPDPDRPGGPVVTYTPKPGACGPDAFVLRFADPAGATTDVLVVVQVLCAPGLSLLPDAVTLTEGETKVVVATATEPNGLPVTIGATPRPSWVTPTTAGPLATSLTLKPVAGNAGSYVIPVTVTSQGGSTTVNLPVTVLPEPPKPNLPPKIDPVPPKDIPPGGPTSIPITVKDPDGPLGPITVDIPTPPTKGTATPGPTGPGGPGGPTISYTPNPGACGPDLIVVRATDAAGSSSETTILVQLLCPPEIVVVPEVTLYVGESRVVRATARDPNDLPLVFGLADQVAPLVPPAPGASGVLRAASPTPGFVDTTELFAPRGKRLALTFTPADTADVGTFFVTLAAASAGGETEKTVKVNVVLPPAPNQAPTVGPIAPATTGRGQSVTASVPVSDPDGPLPFATSIPDGPLQGNLSTTPWSPSANPTTTYTSLPTACGPDDYVVRVADAAGAAGEAIAKVAVTCGPLLDAPTFVTVVEGRHESIPVSATDLNGFPVTFTLGNLPGLGTKPSWATLTDNGNGTATIDVSPPAGSAGFAFAQITATSSEPTSGNLIIRVLPPNQPPALTPIAPVRIPQGTALPIPITWTDADGPAGPPTFTVSDPPGHGTAVIQPGPTVVVTTDPGYCGTDRLTVAATDTGGATSQLLVQLVVTCPPSLDLPATVKVVEGTTTEVVASATDPNGEDLAFTLGTAPVWASVDEPTPNDGRVTLSPPVGAAGTSHPVQVRVTGPGGTTTKVITVEVVLPNQPPVLGPVDTVLTPTGAPVTFTVPWSDPDGPAAPPPTWSVDVPGHGTTSVDAGGTVTYEPAPGWCGPDTVTVRAADALGAQASVLVTVRTTCAPSLTFDSPVTLHEGETGVVTVHAVDLNDLPITFTTGTRPDWVSLLTVPGGSAAVVLQPAPGDAGSYTIPITATSAAGTTKDLELTVLPAVPPNRPPVLTAVPLLETTPGVPVSAPLTWSDPDGPPPGTPPTFSVSQPPPPGTGTATVTPGPAVTFTPAPGACGTVLFAVRATDLAGNQSAVPVVVRVLCPPTLHLPNPVTLRAGEVVTVAVSATDVNNLPVVLGGTTLPPWVTVAPAVPVPANPATMQLQIAPPGNLRGTYTAGVAASSTGGTTTGSLQITVNPRVLQNLPPIVQPVPTVVTEVDTPTTFTVTWTDADGPNPRPTFAVDDPTHGTATVTPTGTVTYTPDAGWCGPDAVKVTADDGDGGVSSVSARVEVRCAPDLDLPASVSVEEGTRLVVLGTASDRNELPVTLATGPRPAFAAFTTPVPGLASIDLTPGFSDEGSYDISVTATSDGRTTTKVLHVVVTPGNRAPVASDVSTSVPAGTTKTVTIPATDPDNDPLTITSVTPATGVTFSGLTLQYTPAAGVCGPVVLQAVVSDPDGASDTAKVTITVVCPLDLTLTPPTLTVNEGTTLTVGAVAVDRTTGNPVTVTVDSLPPFGSWTPSGTGSGTFTFSPTFTDGDPGPSASYPLAVTLTGSGGTVNQLTLTVVVLDVNRAPVVTATSATTARGDAVDVTVAATDPDGDSPLTLTAVGTPAGGTGGSGTATIVGAPADRVVRYTPAATTCGTVTFPVTVSDPQGLTGTATVTVKVTCPPVVTLTPPTLVVSEGTSGSTTVTAVDPEGDPVTITADGLPPFVSITDHGDGTATVTATPGYGDSGQHPVAITATGTNATPSTSDDTTTVQLLVLVLDVNRPPSASDVPAVTSTGTPVDVAIPASDPDGDTPLVVSAVGTPSSGTAAATGPLQVTYTPAPSTCGPVTFPVTVTDPGGLTATASVTVTVVCPPSIAVSPSTLTVQEGTVLDATVTATDPTTSSPAAVSVSGLPPFATFTPGAPGTGVLHLAPGFTDAGTYPVTVTATSTNATPTTADDTTVSTLTITVTDTNRPPTVGDVTVKVLAGTPTAIELQASDPDGDPVAITGITQPTAGTATVTGPLEVTYTGPSGTCQTATLTVTVGDSNGGSDQATVTVTSCPATLTLDTDQLTVAEGATLTVGATATDPTTGGPAGIVVGTLPPFATFTPDPVTPGKGTFAFTPDYTAADPGPSKTYSIPVTLTGTGGATIGQVAVVVTVTDVNRPPVVTTTVSATTPAGTPVAIGIPASDPDGGPVTVTSVTTPGSGTATTTGPLEVTYTPAPTTCGTVTFTATVTDAGGLTATTTVSVLVVCPPSLDLSPGFLVVPEGATGSATATIVDPSGLSPTLTIVDLPPFGTRTDAGGTTTLTFSPGYTDAGSYTVILDLQTPSGPIATVLTVFVPDVDRPPTVADATASTTQGTPVDVGLTIADPDGDSPLTLAIVGPPMHGTASVLTPTAIRYAPAAGWCGDDSVVVSVRDPAGATGTGVVRITTTCAPPPGPPSANAGDDRTAVEGDTLAFNGTAGNGTPSWTVVRLGPGGTPLGDLGPCTVDPAVAAPALSVRCVDDAVLLATLTVVGTGPTAVDSTTLTFTNAPPAITAATPAPGQPLVVDVAFTDPGTADTHRWSLTWSGTCDTKPGKGGDGEDDHSDDHSDDQGHGRGYDGSDDGKGCGHGSGGTTVCTGGAASGDVTPGARSFQATAALPAGSWHVVLTVTDDDGGSDQRTFDVTVAAPTPVRVTGGGTVDTPPGKVTVTANARADAQGTWGQLLVVDHRRNGGRWKADTIDAVTVSGTTLTVRGSVGSGAGRTVVTLVAVLGKPDLVRVTVTDASGTVLLDTGTGAGTRPGGYRPLSGNLQLH